MLINFIKLNHEEIALVLKWRNHQNIKKWMLNQKNITLQEHLNFIGSLKNSKTKDYFLVKEDDEYIGVVDLNIDYLGIYANPNKKKLGDILLKEIINFAFNIKNISSLKAKVFKENLSAIKLYTRFEFKTIKESDKFIIMELNNENR